MIPKIEDNTICSLWSVHYADYESDRLADWSRLHQEIPSISIERSVWYLKTLDLDVCKQWHLAVKLFQISKITIHFIQKERTVFIGVFVCLAVALMSLRSALSIPQNIRLLSTSIRHIFLIFFWEPAYKGSSHEKAWLSEISKIFTKRHLKSELPLNAKIRASTLYQSLGGISMKTSLAIQQAQAQLGIAALRKHQIKPIQSILDHHDTLVIAPTSFGKSAIYQIAALTMAENWW